MREKDLTQRARTAQSSRRNRREKWAGWANGRSSVDLLGFAGHVVHEEILAEGVGSGEVGFAAAHFGDFLDEVDQGIVAGQHESVDHDAGALAFVHFFERLADDEGVEAESVFVDAAVFEGEGRGFSVGDHDDLAHVFFLAEENALGHAEAFSGVSVKGANLYASEFAEGNFFGRVVKEDEAERVPWILRADEMRERHGDALGGSETVFAVEDHAVAAIEKDHRGAGALVLALMDHEVGVGHLDGNLGAFAADGIEKCGADIHVESVAEFVSARDSPGFDAGGKVAGIVAAEATAAE